MSESLDRTRKPNFLMIMVDQERYPVVYETQELKQWRKKYLKAYELLKSRGLEFKNHYAGSTACVPSRATIYTGQYPSLHGVSQTDGVAKSAYDPDMFWLDPHTVPTIGDYFRTAGYQTYWKGKWHASLADITVPGTHDAFLSYNPNNGVPVPKNERLYVEANNLGDYGFDGWVGPEPHGSNPRNSGSSAATGVSGRDVVYKQQTVELIKHLDQMHRSNPEAEQKPWFIMCSFVNPHDIAIFGAASQRSDQFSFKVDPSVPHIPPAPTAHESLATKPSAQSSYRRIYPLALQPLVDTLFYRQLYYSLQLEVDRQVHAVLNALMQSSFYENTIVIFTSDHGELLGAHGGLFQKWYQAYEEAIHVPLIIHNPVLFPKPRTTETLTSHVDLLPTLLGLAGLATDKLQKILKKDHTEVHPLVGRDLSPLVLGQNCPQVDGPIYFMTDDNVTQGLNQVSIAGIPYPAVGQPISIETVITPLPTGKGGTDEVWKNSRYFKNPQFENIPGRGDQFGYRGQRVRMTFNPGCRPDEQQCRPVPDEFEMYNLTRNPLETQNLASSPFRTPITIKIQAILHQILEEQRAEKRLYPTN